MLLAGGDHPAAALNGLKNITIVSALPFVLVMLLLCVALWKDLCRDPLVLRGKVAMEVLEQAVDDGIDRHEGEQFSLMTRENSIVAASGLPAGDRPEPVAQELEAPVREPQPRPETDLEPEGAGR